jgi:hypothetical protein
MSVALNLRNSARNMLAAPKKYLAVLRDPSVIRPVRKGPYRLSLAKGVAVQASPFPYFVQDNFIPEAEFEQLLRCWPEASVFAGARSDGCRLAELTEGRVWDKLPKESQDFWAEFVRVHCVNMVRTSMLAYGAKPVHKYGDALEQLIMFAVNLTETFDPIRFLNIHTHHINEPTLVGTCIYYIDDNGHTERGTDLYGITRPLPIEDYIDLCGELEYEHRKELKLLRAVRFAPNRLLSICDTPITWHGVRDYTAKGVQGPRRMITLQWGMPHSWFIGRYGFDSTQHVEFRKQQPVMNKARDVLRNDLLNLYEEPAYPKEELLGRYGRIKVVSHQRLSHIDEPLF